MLSLSRLYSVNDRVINEYGAVGGMRDVRKKGKAILVSSRGGP
jgi:hypothetical protein